MRHDGRHTDLSHMTPSPERGRRAEVRDSVSHVVLEVSREVRGGESWRDKEAFGHDQDGYLYFKMAGCSLFVRARGRRVAGGPL